LIFFIHSPVRIDLYFRYILVYNSAIRSINHVNVTALLKNTDEIRIIRMETKAHY